MRVVTEGPKAARSAGSSSWWRPRPLGVLGRNTARTVRLSSCLLVAALALAAQDTASLELKAPGPLIRDTQGKNAETLDTYRIGPGDSLQINVWREPDVSVGEVTVRLDGKISLPLVKEIDVAGLTPRELEELLTRRFSQFIRSPDITVIAREIKSQYVHVIGGVNNPGLLPLHSRISVLQAIAEAGGLTEFARRRKIYVLRSTKDGKKRQIPFDYVDVVKGENFDKNIRLYPGDTIVVPE